MSSAFDNGIPNLQSSDATRNATRKTIYNNLLKENKHANPHLVGKYQPVRVCSTDGCVVSTPSYQSKMDVNFGWLLCETPWCTYSMTNIANRSAAGKYLESDTSSVAQPVVDTGATGGTFAGDIYSIYDTDPDSSEIVMDLGGSVAYGVYEPADMHVDPDGKLFSGQQIKTASNTTQDVKYCRENSTSWNNYVAPQSRYTTAVSTNPYKLIASQNTSRVPTNVTYGTKYSIFKTNGSKNENNLIQPCLCQDVGSIGPTMIISSSTLSSGATTNDAVVALIFTSSEETTDFKADDITVTNGVISDFVAVSETSYTATFTSTTDGICSVVVPADTFNGSLDILNTVSNTFAWTYDTVGPTMTISSSTVSSGATTDQTVIALIFTSSKVTTDFASGDITPTNGSISNFAGSGTGYTATFTTAAVGACSVVVAAGTFTGPVGNLNTVSNTFAWTRDTTGPTMTISSSTLSPGSTTNDEAVALIFTSSEATANFASGDITPSNGSISAFAGGPTGYTATFDTTADGACSAVVNAGTFTDSLGLSNTVSNTFAWTRDTVGPTMTISSSPDISGSTINDAVVALIFTSSKITTDFESGDITPSNGSISNFAGSDLDYTATFTSAADGACSAVVNAGTFTGPIDNPNSVSNTFAWTLDRVGPTMTITSSTVTQGATTDIILIALILTSSKVTTDFTSGDITPTNGSITAFGGSDLDYTATFTTTTEGACSVVVNAGTFTGPIGNLNTVSNTFAWTYEDPGGSIVVYLDDSSGNPPAAVPKPPDGTSIPIGVHAWGPPGSTFPVPSPNTGKVLYIGTLTNTGGTCTAVFETGYRTAATATLPIDWGEPNLLDVSVDGSDDIIVSINSSAGYDPLTYGSPAAWVFGDPPFPNGTAVLDIRITGPPGPYPYFAYPFAMWFVESDGTTTQADPLP
jgi:hypothetical protein